MLHLLTGAHEYVRVRPKQLVERRLEAVLRNVLRRAKKPALDQLRREHTAGVLPHRFDLLRSKQRAHEDRALLPELRSVNPHAAGGCYAAPGGDERLTANRSATARAAPVPSRRATISATWPSAVPAPAVALSATARADMTTSWTALLAP